MHRLTNGGDNNIPLGKIIMADCSLSSNMADIEIVSIDYIHHSIYFHKVT